jgi:malate dehydrogenase (oxaloacetate-decarboxylating)
MTGTTVIFRLELEKDISNLPEILKIINQEEASLSGLDLVRATKNAIIRDLSVFVKNDKQREELTHKLKKLKGVRVINISDRTFLVHLGGKLEVESKRPLKTRDDLSLAYTPGVAKVSMGIYEKPDFVYNLTIKGNCVAIISDGSAVLGLGDIGPYAALPVMEGKAQLFKTFANVNAFPICVNTKDVDEIVKVAEIISPVFGGINLEDISAPRCFEIEEKLQKRVDIPVFHDDQHGTAVVVLGALLNALKITGKKLKDIKVALLGVGAAGFASTKILLKVGIKDIVGCDTVGVIYRGRKEHMNPYKEWFAKMTNPENIKGEIKDALKGADVFIGVSRANLITPKMVSKMSKNAIVFAMANPDPEIPPESAPNNVAVFATGRSDYPNQINNLLCFPGLFRGLLEVRAKKVIPKMFVSAAKAIAACVSDDELSPDYVVPSVFNKSVVKKVATAVAKEAIKTNLARRKIKLGS